MKEMRLEGLNPVVSKRIAPFAGDILNARAENIHSMYIIGSSVTPDFNEKTSDTNSVIVLHGMDFGFIGFLASLGKKYVKKGIAAPLVMTPDYIRNSLDVFPIEFLDLKSIHKTIYGDDLLKDIQIDKAHLRLQCEREIKTKLIGLRQGYISSMADRHTLAERLSRSIAGYITLFRAIIYLMGKEPPVIKQEVLSALQEATGIETDIFKKILLLKRKEITLSGEELYTSFEHYYRAAETIGKIVDELQS